MKIVYVSNSFIPSRSANSIQVMKMCQAFAKNGHEVCLLAPDVKDRYGDCNLDAYKYYGVDRCFKIDKLISPRKNGRSLIYRMAVIRRINKISADLLYGRCVVGLAMASYTGLPMIYEAHEPVWRDKKISRLFFKHMIKKDNLKKIIVISNALGEMCLNENDINADKIMVAHDGSDEVSDSEVITPWPGRKGVLQVGYVGHLYDGKGSEVVRLCAEKMPDVDFHLVGGTDKNINEQGKYRMPPNIYLHGFIEPNKVGRYRNSCDVLLAPYQKKVSTFGGGRDIAQFMSPLKIFEYMSHRKAIICSNLSVLREVLNEDNAIMVDPDNIEGWISAINTLKEESIRVRISNVAYKDFMNKYTWKKRAQDVLVGLV